VLSDLAKLVECGGPAPLYPFRSRIIEDEKEDEDEDD